MAGLDFTACKTIMISKSLIVGREFLRITSDLKKVGITVQQNGIDILKKDFTVTTDKKVPEEIISSIREYVENKGFTIKFLNSG